MAGQGVRMRRPVHPGGFVKSEVVAARGLSVSGAARALGVTRGALAAVLEGRVALSAEMAARIEAAFGVSGATLMRMQGSFDLARAGEIVRP